MNPSSKKTPTSSSLGLSLPAASPHRSHPSLSAPPGARVGARPRRDPGATGCDSGSAKRGPCWTASCRQGPACSGGLRRGPAERVGDGAREAVVRSVELLQAVDLGEEQRDDAGEGVAAEVRSSIWSCEQLPSDSGMGPARRLLTRSRKVTLLMPETVAGRGSPAGSNRTGRLRGTAANESHIRIILPESKEFPMCSTTPTRP
jgi:hypothetical protein